MCAQIVEIGDFRLKREHFAARDACKHIHLTLNDGGEFVTCDDCSKQVGNYAALRMLLERWAALQDRLDAQRREVAASSEKTVGLRAAQRVEKAWRSRTMLPTCPHCYEAIGPNDGFGSGMTNKKFAEKRREVTKSEAAKLKTLKENDENC